LTPVLRAQDFVADVLDGDSVLALRQPEHRAVLVAMSRPEYSDELTSKVKDLRTQIGTVVASGVAEGCRALLTGEPVLESDVQQIAVDDAHRLERVALVPAAVILIYAFGSLGAALVPILTGVLALLLAVGGLAQVAEHVPLAVFVMPVVSMIGLGAGIDYSLLVTTRFREARARGDSPSDAAVQTTATAGRTVLVSGLCVAFGFGALSLTPTSETRSVGLAGLMVVSAAVLLSVTLVPAILATTAQWLDRPVWLSARLARWHGLGVWERWGTVIVRHRWWALLGGLAVVGLLVLPISQLEVGVPKQGWFPEGAESTEATALLTGANLEGELLPIEVIVRAPEGDRVVSVNRLRGLKRFADSLAADPRVARVRGPVSLRSGMSLLGYAALYGDLDAARERQPELFGTFVSDDAATGRFQIILGDTTSLSTGMELVRELRAQAASQVGGQADLEVLVGGFAAAQVDEEAALKGAFPSMVALILGATGLMLFLMLRSLLMPVKAILLNALSVAGAFGLLVLVFQLGVGHRLVGLAYPTEALFIHVLVMVFAISFGLSMDYEVFLIARIKERYEAGRDDATATIEGLSHTAGVITNAAAIMVVVFGSFAFSKILMARLLGFGLAAAVLIDATIVRLVIVPAFMRIAGKWNWWPGGRRVQGEG
jgi:RND superfamily putative drug exporter